jgi:hypothetical protein
VLYVAFGVLPPLESGLIASKSPVDALALIEKLIPLYWVNLVLNIAGVVLPIVRYNEWQASEAKQSNKSKSE